MITTVTTFTAAMKDFFGYREGQTLTQFAAELKTLSDEEKAFFKKGLEDNGYKFAAA